jgi:hypothetical protein
MDGASGGGGEAVPPALERVVRRCLEKDPEERFQSARDVAFALEALAGTSGTAAGPAPAGVRPNAWRGLAAIGLAGLAAIGGYLWGHSRPDSTGKRAPVRFVILPPAQAPNIDCIRVSPDGRSLAFQAWGDRDSIWVRSLDETKARPISGTPTRSLATGVPRA